MKRIIMVNHLRSDIISLYLYRPHHRGDIRDLPIHLSTWTGDFLYHQWLILWVHVCQTLLVSIAGAYISIFSTYSMTIFTWMR